MTAKQFRELLERSQWSQRFLASRLGISQTSITDMARGRTSPHPEIAQYLQRVIEAVDRVPLPELGDRRVKY